MVPLLFFFLNRPFLRSEVVSVHRVETVQQKWRSDMLILENP